MWWEKAVPERGEAMEIGTYLNPLVNSQRKFRVKLRNVIKPSYKYTQYSSPTLSVQVFLSWCYCWVANKLMEA